MSGIVKLYCPEEYIYRRKRFRALWEVHQQKMRISSPEVSLQTLNICQRREGASYNSTFIKKHLSTKIIVSENELLTVSCLRSYSGFMNVEENPDDLLG